MANFPSVLNSFTRPTSTDRLNSPSHSALHNTVSSALGQVEAVIGVDGANSVVGTLMYNVRSPASDGGGHVQVANKGGTGQTSYTKGDILVAQSSSVLTKLAISATDGQVITSDSTAATGISWGAGPRPTVRVYSTASVQTWTRPSNLAYIVVEVLAGGGGGGCRSEAPNTPGVAAGGGSGAYAKKIIPASSILASQTIQVGAGGGPAITASTLGSIGGLTTFGSFLTVSGGTFGASMLGSSNTQIPGGTGGSVLVAGDININGQAGGPAISSLVSFALVNIPAGVGGNAPMGYGFGGRVIASDSNGADGTGFGAGGGGSKVDGGAGKTGGTGAVGLIIVSEY